MNEVAMSSGSRSTRLYEPSPVDVTSDASGAPVQVDYVDVTQIREEWIVEEGWWTALPIQRWYFEVVLVDGRDLTVFLFLASGQWFAQRA